MQQHGRREQEEEEENRGNERRKVGKRIRAKGKGGEDKSDKGRKESREITQKSRQGRNNTARMGCVYLSYEYCMVDGAVVW